MRLFGRAPGAVYRVYGEDEYFEDGTQPVDVDGRDEPLGGDPQPAAAAPRFSRPRLVSFAGPRPAALLIAAMIVAVAAIATVLVLHVTARHGSRHAVTASATVGPTEASRGSRTQVVRQTARPSRPPSSPARARGAMRVEHRPPGGSAHAGLRPSAGTSAAPVVAAAAPAAVAPTASSDRSSGGESENAFGEFGFER